MGGLDAGKYKLSNPSQLAIASSNNIFIIDVENLVVFDQYGSGIRIITMEKKLKSIRILFDNLIICSENEVFYSFLKSPDPKLNKLSLAGIETPEIISAILFNSRLYILTKESIQIFNKIN